MIDIDADLENCTDFDTPAVFATTPATTTVNGIFTEASDAALMFGQVEIEATDPSFTCRDSLITAGMRAEGIGVTIDGTAYKVRRRQKVGTGLTVFYLKTT